MRFLLLFLGFLAPATLCAGLEGAFQAEVRPVLAELCFGCHGPEKQKGDFRLDTLNHGSDPETWHDVLDQLNLGEMPPPKETQPSGSQRRLLVDWLNGTMRAAGEARRLAEGRVVMRRLTRYEYANTIRDLLGVEHLDASVDLPPDPASPQGFLNDGAVLEMSPTQVETYLAAARRALEVAIVSGEQPAVLRTLAKESAVGKLPNKKVAGHEPVRPEFALDIREFPREGEFVLRVRARAILPPGSDAPRLRASLGCVPGIVHVPRKVLGEVEVTETVKTHTFHGRMEDFPQPGDVPFRNLGFQGMIAMLDFVNAEGEELRYPGRAYVVPPSKKKGQNPPPPPPDPAEPRLDIEIESLEFEAPVFASWPPPSHRRLLPEGEADFEKALRRFMARAWRRPVSDGEVESLARLFGGIRSRVDSFEEAVRETLAAVLVSPHFLYRVENQEKSLTDHELACRLSYFLWSTMPDEHLFAKADAGRLGEPGVLESETLRMLEDPRAEAFVNRFVEQWLDLGALERVVVNAKRFPAFDGRLVEDMRREVLAVFRSLLVSDLSALELIDADWTMLNRSLARHYGIEGPRSARFERVALPPGSPRGGLLGTGAFLLAGSNGESSHPIKRGVWILDRLLDSPPAPPPADTPELDPANPDLAGLSLKQQLAVHREKEACANCHRGIDPWGVSLESFDAVGRWRTEVGSGKKRKPVDAVSVMPDGTEVRGVDELKRYLLEERREWFARALVVRMAGYALGRSLDLGDRDLVESLTKAGLEDDLRLKGMIVRLVQSELFRVK